MSVLELLESFEDEVLDPEEETFALFSAPIPSANLGFIDPRAAELDITLPPNRDFTIHQSPTLLASSRAGGTTGAVLWKITPLFAAFLSSPDCPFLPRSSSAPTGPASSDAAVLELGCGISALTGLACGPRVGRYVLTDQPYVARLVQRNLDANERAPAPARRGAKGRASSSSLQAAPAPAGHVFFEPLDWELDEVTPALTRSDEVRSFDLVVACDCIYNDALVEPLVQTSVDACLLRRREEGATARGPTLCIVAQQLRSPEVFEAWLKAFHRRFRVWRVPDQVVGEGLASDPGSWSTWASCGIEAVQVASHGNTRSEREKRA